MNEKILVITAMIFLHIVDDYYLQGILAQLKQKSWWEEHYPDRMYKNDYRVALFVHGLSWSIMVHAPVMVYRYINNKSLLLAAVFILVHAGIHAYVDHCKVNRKTFNLLEDQTCHLCQIMCTAGILLK